MSKSSTEKAAFAERLKLALTRCPKKIETATELATQFNLRHTNESVTHQAVQKWLSGSACPTADKINTLAEWLGVSAHWLRFGSPAESPRKNKPEKRQITTQADTAEISSAENQLLAHYRFLTPHQQDLISGLIIQLALDKEAWPSQDPQPKK